MTKTFELIYSQQKRGFVEGRAYSNPRFYSAPRDGVTKVFLVGDWPKIEADYRARGVPVERLDAVQPAAPAPAPAPKAAPASAAEIPADWRNRSWQQLRSLAAVFSDEPVLNKAQAVAAIEAELAHRASDEEGPNGLTRRQMNADLAAAGVEIDPDLSLADLAALHGSL